MQDWFMLNLGDAVLASERLGEIEARLQASRVTGAVYMRHESEGRLHCELKLYFTPELAELAATLGALPCMRPSPVGLGPLAGSKEGRAGTSPQAPD